MNDSAGAAWYMCKTTENFMHDVVKISTISNVGRRAGPEKVKDGTQTSENGIVV